MSVTFKEWKLLPPSCVKYTDVKYIRGGTQRIQYHIYRLKGCMSGDDKVNESHSLLLPVEDDLLYLNEG